mmetsp:Transcript_34225/g.65913  ORF Transcript_34225/g.65913 Transcript_34225/m.65913 type:complete len:208 (-) Transcript_34225:568-1191(-)
MSRGIEGLSLRADGRSVLAADSPRAMPARLHAADPPKSSRAPPPPPGECACEAAASIESGPRCRIQAWRSEEQRAALCERTKTIWARDQAELGARSSRLLLPAKHVAKQRVHADTVVHHPLDLRLDAHPHLLFLLVVLSNLCFQLLQDVGSLLLLGVAAATVTTATLAAAGLAAAGLAAAAGRDARLAILALRGGGQRAVGLRAISR